MTPHPELLLLDREQLEPFIEVGLDEFRSILHDVIEETPRRMTEIYDHLTGGRFPEAKRVCHSLRGMLSNFGCQQLCHAIHHLEHGPPLPPEQASARMQEIHNLWILSLGAILEWEQTAGQ